MKTPENCPNCGADVPRGARACPECGADEESGWSEEAETPGNLGIPDDSFNYDEFVKREFEGEATPDQKRRGFWRMIGFGLVILFAFSALYFVIVALFGRAGK